MSIVHNAERRDALDERRRPLRPIRCMHCGALLTYERRGSIVRLYAAGNAPLPSMASSEPHAPPAVPRCVVCHGSLLPIDAELTGEEQLA